MEDLHHSTPTPAFAGRLRTSPAARSQRGVWRVQPSRSTTVIHADARIHDGQVEIRLTADPCFKEALNESILDSSEHARRKCDFHLASKSVTDVTDFGGTSLCRTESLIQSEIP